MRALHGWFGFLTLGLFLGAEVLAQEAPESPPPPAAAKAAEWAGALSFTFPVAVQDFDPLPSGFSSKNFSPPVSIGLSMEAPPVDKNPGLLLSAQLANQTYALNTMFGVSAGPQWNAGKEVVLGVGLSVESQGLLKSAPLKNSHMDNWRYGAWFKLTRPMGRFKPGLVGRWVNPVETNIAAFEGLVTQIRWEESFVLRPELLWERDPEIGIIDAVEASLGLHFLGATAIASKEFAFLIDSQAVFRPELAVSTQALGLEWWVRGSVMVLSRSTDPVAYLYQATSYQNDYMLAPKTLAVEARWKF